MRYLEFGATGMRVAPLALGTGQLGALNGKVDAELARAVLLRYLDAGGNVVDSAEAYQGGKSEELIGETLSDRRDDVLLISKYARGTTRNASPGRGGGHRKAMVQAVEGSLRRLRTDRIDVYFAHFDDSMTPVEEIMRGFDDLISAGKILYGGLSNFPAWRTALAAGAARAHEWAPLSSIEIEYSLLHRTAEREILPLARAERLAVLAYSPLAAGALAKPPGDGVPSSRNGIDTEVNAELVIRAVQRVAAELEMASANVALAWLSAKGCFPVIGPRNADDVTQLMAASDLALEEHHLRELDDTSAIRMGYPHELLATQQRNDKLVR